MFQQRFLKRTGMRFLAAILLCSADVHKAKAASAEDDAKRLVALGEWVSGAWGYIEGAKTAFDFLTGVDNKKELTLDDIKGAIDDALVEQHDRDLVEDVQRFAANFHNTALDISAAISDPMLALRLSDHLFNQRTEGTNLFTSLNTILRLPSNVENDRRVITVMPAYTVLVPLLVSTTKLISDILPGLKTSADQQISETLAKAQQAVFMAAGANTLYAYEPGENPNFFYSPVSVDSRWMTKWPLYAYHYWDGGAKFGPQPPFQVYQNIPVVKLALDSLENIVKAQPSMVWAEHAVIWDLNGNRATAPFVLGWIIQVRDPSTPVLPALASTGSVTLAADGKCNGSCFGGASVSSTGDLMAFFWSGSDWNVVNVSAKTGYQEITGPVTSWQTEDGPFTVEHVAAASPGGDLLIFFASSPEDWQVVNVSTITRQQIAGPVTSWQRLESRGVPPGDPGGGTFNVEYLAGVSPGGDLLVFLWSPRADWQVVNVTEQTRQKIARTGRGPFVSRLTSWRTRGLQSLAAASPWGDLLVFSESPGDFRHWDVVNVSRQTGPGHHITGPVTRWVTSRGPFLVEQLAGASPSGDLLVFSSLLLAGTHWTVANVSAITKQPITVPLTSWRTGAFEHLAAVGPFSDFLVFYRRGFSTRTDPVGWGVCPMSMPGRNCTNELH